MSATPPLAKYNEKRDFGITPEPAGEATKPGAALSYVIQKHWATRLHYDFRLELDGVLLSWAVPKGPSFDPSVKRMAIHVEDHPVAYGGFEGRIPEKQYGAGKVILWDRGTWEPVGDPRAGLKAGKLVFQVHGEKLAGLWELVRIAKPDDRQEAWLLFKKKGDAWARAAAEYDVTEALPDSVLEKPLGPADARGPGGDGAVAATPVAAAVVAPMRVAKKAAKAAKAAGKSSSKRSRAKGAAANGGAAQVDAAKDGAANGSAALPGAVKAALPETLSPQLATLAKKPPTSGDWSVEAKFDGYRLLARIANGKARLITRNGNDWTDKLGSLAEAVEALGVKEGWLDGEIVVGRQGGGQDFNGLQNAIDAAKSDGIVYFLFDAPFLDGHDLRRVPLFARRAALKAILDERGSDRVRFSDDFPSSPEEVLKAACAMRLEGVIAKRRDAPYLTSRSDTWIKLKCTLRQEFVIGGYGDRANSETEVGNLLLGVYDDGKLRYCGAVGTGWKPETARELKQKLRKLAIDKTPFETGSTKQTRWSRRTPGGEHWVKPTMVAEVSFAEWTPEGHLRHASFQGLRTDKPATAIVRELPVDVSSNVETTPETPAAAKESAAAKKVAAKKVAVERAAVEQAAVKQAVTQAASKKVSAPKAPAPAGKGTVSGVKVSSPERVIDPSTGTTKLDVVRYYDSVADLILPHLRGRPVSLVRGPQGITGELFFQKHMEHRIAGIDELDPSVWPGHTALMEINTREALLAAAQMNTIEFHTWNAKSRRVDTPDRMIFDLDPGEGTTWTQIQEGATLTKAILDELGLVSFLKTSGGKGLHVVVPITPKLGWDAVKGFSQAVVQHLAKTIPDRFVAKAGGVNRVGKIFVDWLRNGHGATTATAFSVRSRPGLGVSIPVPWDALPDLRSGAQWTVADARDAVAAQRTDPWAAYAKTKQTLTGPMKRLGFEPDG